MRMKVKEMIMIVVCVFMCGCSEEKTEANAEPSQLETVIQSELDKRGVKFGMTEDEVKSIEKDINFVVDPNLTAVDEEHIVKTIYSESNVKYGDYDAKLEYAFYDNSLQTVTYTIDLDYSSSELSSSPAYSLFLDYTLKYTDILGNPQIANVDNDNSFWTWYTNIWHDGDENADIYTLGNTAKHGIYLYAKQSTYQTYTDDYSDSVTLSFIAE